VSGIEALQNVLNERPGAQDEIAQFEQAARSDWGEYLALSSNEPGPAKLNADEEVSLDHAPAVDMKTVLAALGEPPAPAAITTKQNDPKNQAVTSRVGKGEVRNTRVPVAPAKPASVDIEPSILEAFLEDACRCLVSMEQAVLVFEAAPTSHEPLVQVCRELHTLKGAASSVGLTELAGYLHEVEDFVEGCRSLAPAEVDVEPMLRAVDAVRDQIEACGGTAQASLAVPGVDAGRRTGPTVATNSPTRSVTWQGGPAGAAPSTAPSLRVEGSRIERLMDLLAELVTLRNARDNRLVHLREVAAELTRCAGRIRAAGDARGALPLHPRPEGGASSYAADRPWADPLLHEAVFLDGGGSLLTEIASDVSELARSLREIEEPLSADNRVVSRLIGQFRHELIDLRRVPVTGLFRRLERPARDAAHSEGKQVKVVFVGEDARIERSLQEVAYEPLLHIVRNAVSHGIETPDERQRAGKPTVGTITLEARSSPSLLVLEVRDDGRGMDYEALERRGRDKGLLPKTGVVSKEDLLRLIFHPGFSTRTTVSEVSGRGVGMDVVARSIDRMGGHVDVDSVPGGGTTLRLSVPLRTGIEHAMLVRVAGQIFALPLHSVDVATGGQWGGPPRGVDDGATASGNRLARMGELLGLRQGAGAVEEGCLILNHGELAPSDTGGLANGETAGDVRRKPRKFPLAVDSVIGPEEVVVRSLPRLLKNSKLFSGVTLSGAGEIVLLFNVPRLIALHQEVGDHRDSAPDVDEGGAPDSSRLRVLVADDSLSARRSLSQSLERWGYVVTGAADGLEALDLLRNHAYDLVLTDLEMPKLGGLEVLAETKRRHQTRHVPVVVMTGRNDDATRVRAQELGADGYLTKPVGAPALSETLADLNLLKQPVHDLTDPADFVSVDSAEAIRNSR
jgi:chemotaxis protein histidine kinase CheA